jgi:putative PIN family toxin of toxin-antitoxin system
MKVVLDTNILIDGFKDEFSYEKRIIDAIRQGYIEAYANRETLRENKLIVSKLITGADYEKALDEFFEQVNWVKSQKIINVVSDPEDNKILASALSANAHYLITNDKALLELKKYRDITILEPIAFWAIYTDKGMDWWQQLTNFYFTKN